MLKRFFAGRAARGGNVSMLFAMGLLPILLLIGMAADVSRAMSARNRVATALDAAGLAAGRLLTSDETALLAEVERFLQANLSDSDWAMIGSVTVSLEGGARIVADAELTVPMTLASLAGLNDMEANAHTEIVRETNHIELALVLDNTGSMASSGKIEALRTAARDLVEVLFEDDDASDFVDIAIVPYVTAVNIGLDNVDMAWMDTEMASARHGENFSPRTNHFELFDTMGVAWAGCVEMRAAPYDVTDDPPDVSTPDTLWTPYLWPDEPAAGGAGADFDNDYIFNDEDDCPLCAGLTGADLYVAQQADTGAYANGVDLLDQTPPNTAGPNMSCGQPMTPLTNDYDRLIAELDAMQPWNNSGTNGAAGLAWGWRALSPTPPFTEGVSYDDEDVVKVIVLMTDGENQIWGGWDSPNMSNYSGYGYLSTERLGTTSSSTAKGRINDRILELCENIRDEGVIIYTVTFRLTSTALKQVFRDCATSPDHYFDSSSNDELIEHFTAIAGELSRLRVAR